MEERLLEPVTYYKQIKGKDIRTLISNALGEILQIPQKDVDDVINFINNMHNSSLVIDDIQDNSLLRRNHECAHIKYGIPLALNSGYLCIFKTLFESFTLITNNLEITEKTKNNAMLHIIENLYLAHVGQGMDIYFTKNQIIPSLDEFYKMIEYKTGTLFTIILDILLIKSKNIVIKRNKDVLRQCLIKLSYFFQIRDDYINLVDREYWKDKGVCQDFDEKKISFLITYYCHYKLPEHESIIEKLNASAFNDDNKWILLKIFHDNGLFDMIYDELTMLKTEILDIMNLQYIFDMLPYKRSEFFS
jgi:geranylgeranyl pyrophosphate synthase